MTPNSLIHGAWFTIGKSERNLKEKTAIIKALQTGMRKSEVLGFKWSNIDLVNRLIIVEGTKSGYVRKIPMSKKLTETLENGKKGNHGEFVFSDRKGKPYKSFRSVWDHALQKQGLRT